MKRTGCFAIIRLMDVYIAEEAEAGLRAEALVIPAKNRRGVLLGHRRGPRYFVARIFPLGGLSFPDASRIRRIDRLFGGRLIGFYAARDPVPGPESLLQPFACGKLFLRVPAAAARSGGSAVRPAIIEFDGGFRLSPVSLAGRRP